jgi:DNA-binding NarL/FixJ family response regulator
MTEQSIIRVLTVLKHPLFREGIATVINNQADMLLVAEAESASEGYELFNSHRPDVTLMDLRLPDSGGIEAMNALRARHANAHVVLVCNFEGDLEIQHALDAGASGCILKTMHPKQIVAAIRSACAVEKKPPSVIGRVVKHIGDDTSPKRRTA